MCLVERSYLVKSGVTTLILCADDLSGFLSKLNLLPTVVYKRTSVFWRGLGTIVHLGYIVWLIDWFSFPKCLLLLLFFFGRGGGDGSSACFVISSSMCTCIFIIDGYVFFLIKASSQVIYIFYLSLLVLCLLRTQLFFP